MTSRALLDQRPTPIAECAKCSRAYSKTEYGLIPVDGSGFRRCMCGLPLVKVATVTLVDVLKAYDDALKGSE